MKSTNSKKSTVSHLESSVDDKEEDTWTVTREVRFDQQLRRELHFMEVNEFHRTIRRSFTEYIHHHAVPLLDRISEWSEFSNQLLFRD